MISGTGYDGVQIGYNSNSNVVAGNKIGTNVSGTAALGNASSGVEVDAGCIGNTIGGTTADARDVISGNGADGDWDGVDILGSGAIGNVVEGDYIGTDVSGTQRLGNFGDGVDISDASNNTIGGTTAGARNVISGNAQDGVYINGSATGNLVAGNYIGSDVTGTKVLGNAYSGVKIADSASKNTIGGTAAGDRNVISGKARIVLDGVDILDGGAIGQRGRGQLHRHRRRRHARLGNFYDGVDDQRASNNTIGGTTAGAGNVISGNAQDGGVHHGSATGNLIEGNYIGTDVDRDDGPGQRDSGVAIADSASNNTIGGTAAGDRNVISGNAADSGWDVLHPRQHARATWSRATTSAPTSPARNLGNVDVGVHDHVAHRTTRSAGPRPGPATSSPATPRRRGVHPRQRDRQPGRGNYIGTDVAGTSALGNAYYRRRYPDRASTTRSVARPPGTATSSPATTRAADGISSRQRGDRQPGRGQLHRHRRHRHARPWETAATASISRSAANNTIGGTTAGAATSSPATPSDGVYIDGGATGNLIAGNYIGTDVTGTRPWATHTGVKIAVVHRTTPSAGPRPGPQRHLRQRPGRGDIAARVRQPGRRQLHRYRRTGTRALGNAYSGVADSRVVGMNNTIGGTAAGARNVISGNPARGVHPRSATANLVAGNFIGTDDTGTMALGNAAPASRSPVPRTTRSAAPRPGTATSSPATPRAGCSSRQRDGQPDRGQLHRHRRPGRGPGQRDSGVEIDNSASNNTIGGTTAGDRNVISGNAQDGVFIYGGARGNLVAGNYIGTDTPVRGPWETRTPASRSTKVHRTTRSAGQQPGMATSSRPTGLGDLHQRSGTRGDVVQGNFIGTDVTGTKALGNAGSGVEIDGGAANNTIGGTTAGARNVISGNGDSGVLITGAGTTGVVIEDNYIGTDVTGTKALRKRGLWRRDRRRRDEQYDRRDNELVLAT